MTREEVEECFDAIITYAAMLEYKTDKVLDRDYVVGYDIMSKNKYDILSFKYNFVLDEGTVFMKKSVANKYYNSGFETSEEFNKTVMEWLKIL